MQAGIITKEWQSEPTLARVALGGRGQVHLLKLLNNVVMHCTGHMVNVHMSRQYDAGAIPRYSDAAVGQVRLRLNGTQHKYAGRTKQPGQRAAANLQPRTRLGYPREDGLKIELQKQANTGEGARRAAHVSSLANKDWVG